MTGTASLVSLSIMIAMPTPQFGWQPQVSWPNSFSAPCVDVGPVGEAAHERDREPVADRLADAGLVLHVVREVRQRVALRGAALRRHFLVAAGERHRLERQEVDLLRVVERELDDRGRPARC